MHVNKTAVMWEENLDVRFQCKLHVISESSVFHIRVTMNITGLCCVQTALVPTLCSV
jgi:hypothetical protein